MTLTVRKAFENLSEKLKNEGIENPKHEARQIIYHATGYSPLQVLNHYNDDIGAEAMAQVIMDYAERIEGRPLQYIVGKWGFYNVDVFVGEGVLIPRQDTETLVDCGLEFLDSFGDTEVLDLCTGSGCEALSVKKARGGCTVSAGDKFETPLEYINKNAKLNSLDISVIRCDVFDQNSVSGEFGLILCNPPYIKSADIDALQREVKREPKEALDGGEDGLMFYRALAEKWTKKLKPNGMLAVEIGIGQEEDVKNLFRDAGLKNIKSYPDANGILRVVSGIYLKDGKNDG